LKGVPVALWSALPSSPDRVLLFQVVLHSEAVRYISVLSIIDCLGERIVPCKCETALKSRAFEGTMSTQERKVEEASGEGAIRAEYKGFEGF
jgi:hypothetical protein